MKIQRERLERALNILECDLIIKGKGMKYDISPIEWSGDRYQFLKDLECLCGYDGFVFEYSHNDKIVTITIIGVEEYVSSKIICLIDLFFK